MDTIELEVQGMSCGTCADKVNRALRPVKGVDQISIHLEHGRVNVTGDFLESGAEPLITALETAGFSVRAAKAGSTRATAAASISRAGGGGCCGGNR